MTKKAWKRLGKFGIGTHDPNLCEIYLIKMIFSEPICHRTRRSTQMTSIPSYLLEPLFLGVKVSCLPLFTEKSCKGFKIAKISKKWYNIKNALFRIGNLPARGLSKISNDALTNLATELLRLTKACFRKNISYGNLVADFTCNYIGLVA